MIDHASTLTLTCMCACAGCRLQNESSNNEARVADAASVTGSDIDGGTARMATLEPEDAAAASGSDSDCSLSKLQRTACVADTADAKYGAKLVTAITHWSRALIKCKIHLLINLQLYRNHLERMSIARPEVLKRIGKPSLQRDVYLKDELIKQLTKSSDGRIDVASNAEAVILVKALSRTSRNFSTDAECQWWLEKLQDELAKPMLQCLKNVHSLHAQFFAPLRVVK